MKEKAICLLITLLYLTLTPKVIYALPEDYEIYVTEVPDSWESPMGGAEDLQVLLEEQVADLITGERYAPYFLTGIGKVTGLQYFWWTYETFYALSVAYPFLNNSLQAQVKNYLINEYDRYPPLGVGADSRYPVSGLQAGRRREYFDISNLQISCDHDNNCTRGGTPEELYQLYSVWTFAHFTDSWDVIESDWNYIKSVAASNPLNIISFTPTGVDWSVNRKTAGFIGYARIAQGLLDYEQSKPVPNAALIADYQNASVIGLQKATQSLEARINWELSNQPIDGDPNLGWEFDEDPTRGVFAKNGCCGDSWIPRYVSLSPEIGKALYDKANTDVQRQNEYMDTVWPMRYMTYSPQNRNEVHSIFPDSAMEHFVQKAFIMQLPGNTLRQYISYPWSKGDLYYILKLAYVIRATNEIPITLTPTPSPAPQRKPGDANDDGVVDGVDYVIWLIHYNQSTANGYNDGDFNDNGVVDGVDYVIWLNNYGT